MWLRPAYSKHLTKIGHDNFMELLQGTFNPSSHGEDILALLKRANVVIFGRQAVYFRAASPEVTGVQVVHYPEAKDYNLLSNEVGDRMSAYKKGKKVSAPSEDVDWSTAFVNCCMCQKDVVGFRYEVVHGEDVSFKPQVKEVKPTLESMTVPSADDTPGYIPGMAASSGTNNTMEPGVNVQSVNGPPKVSAPDSESARAPATSRKFTSLKSQTSQAIVVFDLSDDENMLGAGTVHGNVSQPPSSRAHAPATQNESASQSALAMGIGELMSQMNPQDVPADEDAGTDVEVSPFQLPPDADQSD